MLSPIASEAASLLSDCDEESVNAYGLSKLALAGQPGSEWRRTSEFTMAIEELQAEGLLRYRVDQRVHNLPPETWHYRFDRDQLRAALAFDALSPAVHELGRRARLSPLAAG